jgi:NAD(P)H-quinone oxidoreductase subunit H
LKRVEGVGFIGREEAINWGLSGAMLRGSGVQWDLRKLDHYECYDEFDWQVEWQTEGDCLARYLVRIGETERINQNYSTSSKSIPGGPYENLEARELGLIGTDTSQWNDFEYQFIRKNHLATFKLPRQKHYV